MHNYAVLIHAKLTHYTKRCDLYWATSRKPLTLLGAPCLQYFGNKAIVLRKTTNEYFQYLFGPWDAHKAGFAKPLVQTGAVTLIQRFGSALNLNIHFQTTARAHGLRLKAPTLGTLQTLPDCQSDNPFSSSVGEAAGFSLHAGVATKANERTKLERLCRYITRPAVSTKRLTLTRNGQLRYELNQE